MGVKAERSIYSFRGRLPSVVESRGNFEQIFAGQTANITAQDPKRDAMVARGRAAMDSLWAEARRAAGVNPNDETGGMSPQETLLYRQVPEDKTIKQQVLLDTLFPEKDLFAQRKIFGVVKNKLNKKLAEIGKVIVNVGAIGDAEFIKIPLDQLETVIEKYKTEREAAAAAASERARQEAESLKPGVRLISYLPQDVHVPEVAAAELATLMFPDHKLDTARSMLSRSANEARTNLTAIGRTVISVAVGGSYFYAIVRIEDAEKRRREIFERQYWRQKNGWQDHKKDAYINGKYGDLRVPENMEAYKNAAAEVSRRLNVAASKK